MMMAKMRIEYRDLKNGRVEMDFAIFHQLMGWLQADEDFEVDIVEMT